MELSLSPLTYLILIANIITSIKGFQNASFLDKELFKIGRILHKKEWGRIVNSGFVHANWAHLFFNMYSLYVFGVGLEAAYGSLYFGATYFLSLIGGNLLSLLLHRHEPDYASLGASGAVNGIIFSCILLLPDMEIGMMFLPIGIPGWMFAVLYTLYTMYGMKAQQDNIGHDAHLGGAIIGIVTTLCFFPPLLLERPILIAAILVPSIVFLYMMVQHPHAIGLPSLGPKRKTKRQADDHYNQIRAEKEKELNRILDKINKSGMESLDDYEKRFLNMNT
jgi:membrane associated rhomboid family serine protease